MTNRVQDIALAIILMLISSIWTWLVINSIPPGFGEGEIGARAFPLTFGVMLFCLSTMLLFRKIKFKKKANSFEEPSKAGYLEENTVHWMPAFLVLCEVVLYGFLLEKIGFVLATPIIIFLVMFLNLRIRSYKKILIMSLGLTFTCWLIFEKVMGLYLANGVWINIG